MCGPLSFATHGTHPVITISCHHAQLSRSFLAGEMSSQRHRHGARIGRVARFEVLHPSNLQDPQSTRNVTMESTILHRVAGVHSRFLLKAVGSHGYVDGAEACQGRRTADV